MIEKEDYRDPDWKPENAGPEFAVKILKGKTEKTKTNSNIFQKSVYNKLSLKDYTEGVINSNRNILAKTITLIESNSNTHHKLAGEVLEKLLPYSGKSIRIGITGVPGAGKSSIIENLGMYLISLGKKIAVLTIDPSSTISGGSILGDKTRMENLAKSDKAFIRPSPSAGNLGGVARKTRETIVVCEAAGYDVIIIETVGVGQSEITVRSMVDFFLLVLIAGAGDELQGIKKGIMELTDAIVINKADGNNIEAANRAVAENKYALHLLTPATKGWVPECFPISAVENKNISKIWDTITKFQNNVKESGIFFLRRKEQSVKWMYDLINEGLFNKFYSDNDIKLKLNTIKKEIIEEKILPSYAAEDLLNQFFERNGNL